MAWPIVVMADPVSGSILTSLAISAVFTGASAGLQYLLVKNQKPNPVDRGKQDDIRVSMPGYGEFIPKGYGMFRVAPIWFWHTPTVHTTITTPGQPGGKGTPKPPTPDTIDHIYTKSVAGVFHDGQLFGGVSRVWFDTDLVLNFTDSLLASVRNEAEFGVLAGGATVATQTECSGDKKVTGIGNGGTCTISVDTDSGAHVLSVHYTSTTQLTFKVSVNGGANVDLVCPSSGGAGIVAIETMNVTFNAGVNTVAFSNSGAACPDLDYIDCAPSLVFDAQGRDTRSWTGVVDPAKIIPTNRDEAWPYYNTLPAQSSTGVVSTNLAKWGQPAIRIYKGTETQEADPAIIADKGAANTSAYRGFAYIVIEGIQLQNGRLPNVTIECLQGVHSLPPIVEDIYELVNVSNDKLNVTALQGLTLGSATIDAGSYSATTFASTQNMATPGGGAATKNAGANNAWNAYATASSFSSGNKAIRFTAGSGTFLVGFASSATPAASDVLFGVICNLFSQDAILGGAGTPMALQMLISGVQSRDVGHWASGDTFQIELREGRFRLYQKGFEIFGFSPPVATFPLFPCVMGYTTGAGVSASSTATSIGAVPASNAGGLLVTSRKSAESVLADLQTRFQFDMIEIDGQVKAVLRNGTSDLTIPYGELRAHNDGEEMPAFDALITDVDPLLLPQRMDVSYLDPALDYHNHTQSDMRIDGPQREQGSVTLSIIDSADNMKKLATTLLYKPEMEGRNFKFTTGPKYLRVHPGTVITLTLPNSTHVVRVTESRYALPAGVCEFEAVRQQASIYVPSGVGSVPGIELPIAPIPGNTKGVIIDGPLLRAEDGGDGTEPVVYIAMSGRGAGDWNGGFWYQEHPIGSDNFQFVTAMDRPCGIGRTSGTLASVTDPSVWDRTNSLTINFYSNTILSSATEQDVLANPELNLLAVINPSTNAVEYIQFATAGANATTAPFITSYTVSVLLRGRIGSDANVGSHTSADDVVVIDGNVKPRRMLLADIGRALDFRFVTSGQSVDDAETVTQTLRGNSLLPLAPSNVRGRRDAAGNLLIEWTRRARLGAGLRSSTDVPLAEEDENYELDIVDGSTVKRTIQHTGHQNDAALLSATSGANLISGNNIIAPGGPNDVCTAFTLQQLDHSGAWVEVRLVSVGDSFANVGLWEPQFAPLIGGPSTPDTFFIGSVRFTATNTAFGTIPGIEIAERARGAGGGLVAKFNSNSLGPITSVRIRIIVRDSKLFYYWDYAGEGSEPLLISDIPAPLPLTPVVFVTAIGTPAKVQDITVGTLMNPSVVYTTRDQENDFGSIQSSVTVDVCQVSAVVGRGPKTRAVL